MNILFVCLGNICRSPMAHAYMQDLITRNPDCPLRVDSCGTSGWHQGEPPHHGTLKILHQDHIDTSHLVSRPLIAEDFEIFDVIIGMDRDNVHDLMHLAPNHHTKIHLFLDVLDSMKGTDVPDPWYTGDFKETQSLIKSGVTAWFDTLNTARISK